MQWLGDTVTINWGSQTVSYVLTGTDIQYTASITVSSAKIAAQGDGTFSVTATVTHLTQTGASSAGFSVTVDTVALSAPSVALTTDSGTSNADLISNVGTLNVTGDPVHAVEYSADGSSWSASPPALSQGANTIHVRQTDLVR